MKKLEKLNLNIEKLRAILIRLNSNKKNLINREKKRLLSDAKIKAKFKIGDIIEYGNSKSHQILVTYIACYNCGNPWYGGIEVLNGKLTRNLRRTEGWGHQHEIIDDNGNKYPSTWKKVGDCSMLIFQKNQN